MVLAIVLIHDIIEIGGHLPNLGFLYFLPITLFVLPAIYAALNFGWAGTVATVAWTTALNLPNWFLWHVGMQRAGVPPLLDDLGLVASVRKLLVDLADRSAAEVHLQVLGQPQRLHWDTELGFYRIAQEALLNVERHSGAKNVTVELALGEQRLTLKVVDDGRGFAMPSSPVYLVTSGHLGLIGMQERAELLGGRLSIESGVCQGTKVSVYADLPGARPAIGV